MIWWLRCASCPTEFPMRALSRCTVCGGVLSAVPAGEARWPTGAEHGMWRYRDLLPPVPEPVTLGEGATPLLACPATAARCEIGALLVKNETSNPTLSFKDRPMALGVSLALAFGAPGVVAASTGNTAVSAAAYAARAGLPCLLTCAEGGAAGRKPAMARAHGARVEEVAGDFSDAHAAAVRAERDGWFPLTTTYRNPYLTEAHRTIAFELWTQCARVPDWVVVPVGAGPLLTGVHRGFRALLDDGVIDRVPRMVAVQARACCPIVRAWRDATAVRAATPASTVAGAIADPMRGYEDEGSITLGSVRDSAGSAVAVSDEEMLRDTAELARVEGLRVEPASGAAVSAVRSLRSDGAMGPQDQVVVLATGHGAKDPLVE